MYEMKYGTATLFKNEEKQKENHPDYKGKIKINGEEQQLAAWIKTAKSGKKYMSLSYQPFQNRTNEARQAIDNSLDEDVPF